MTTTTTADTGTGTAAAVHARDLARVVHDRLRGRYPTDGHPGRMPPVDELVCTILSQNTTDSARDRAFATLRAAFPDWEAVRDAPTADVEDCIRVCGLANQKAPRIQGALRAIAAHTGGALTLDFLRDLPRDEARAWLTAIDGVGIKTASIVLLFALGIPALPVDTHVHRVSGRLGLIGPGTSAEKAHHVLEAIVPPEHYMSFHMALIGHGRAVCRAQRPRCAECPLADVCPGKQDTTF
jgi:endonuclease III